MPSLGDLHYSLSIRDNTEADLRKINEKLRNLGFDIVLTPKILKDITQAAVPKGVKIELDPTIKTDAIAKAVEGKAMRVAVTPLLTGFREAIAKATRENPVTAEVGVSETRLRSLIQNVLNKQGFTLNVSTVNDNYSKAIQAKFNGTPYKVKIHVDARKITQSIQASLMQVQSRYLGLKVSRDILYRSIDEALGQKRFNINIAVSHGQARQAVQDALLRAQVIGKDQALAYQRLQTGEMKAAQAELLRLKAAQHGAAGAAKAHVAASVNLGGALGSNIKIAGELGSAMASLYSVHTLKEILAQVVQIGGELEHQKIAMDTIFGDKGKTNELFSQIKGLARNSPFGVMELSKSVKALSAYGVEYNAIYDTAKRLADISAATSVDINRLILAFGKTKSRGFLDGLEAKQFAYANIPIYEMVRKKLEELEGQTVTTADVMARMKKREIGFDIVQSVLWDITDPGGKFYDMQEALAGSVKTSWKLVRDNLELMFGEIAESGIGSGLKGLAEILQELTQKWKTVGLVAVAAAAELGIYKLATLATNMTVQKSTTAIYSNIMAQKQKSAEELKAWGRITQLDRVEKMRIATVSKLINEDLRNAIAAGQLNDKHIAQLYWQKKITAAQVEYLAKIKLIDPMMAKAMLANNAFTRSLAFVAVGLKKAANAAVRFLFNPWTLTFAAISAVISAWQSYSQQMEKAEELSENLFTKADEGAKNLKATLKDLKPASELEGIQLDRGIETLEQALKDYSPTPIKDINDALVDQDGHVRSLAERYEVLREKVEATADAYDAIRNGKDSEFVERSVKATGSFLNDTVVENAKDYTERLKAYNSEIDKFANERTATIQDLVQRAKKSSSEFAKVAETLGTVEAQFKELISGKYFTAQDGFFWELAEAKNTIRGNSSKYFGLGEDALGAESEFKNDVKRQIKSIAAWIKANWGVEVSNLSKDQKLKLSIALKSMLDGAEGVSEEVKAEWAAMLEKAFNVQVMEDKIAPALQANFRNMMAEGMKEGVKDAKIYREVAAVLQTEGYDKLSKAGKELADKVMGKAKETAIKDLGIMTGEMQLYLTNHPLSQIITLTYQDGTQNALQKEIVSKRGVAGYYGSTKTYVDSWTKSGKIDEARSSARSEGKALKKTLTEAKKTGVGIEGAQKAWDKYQAAIAYLGWGDLDLSDKKGRGNADEFAKQLEQRFKDVKDAYAMFKKWAQIEGESLAFERVGNSGLFSTLDPDKVPKTVDEYRKIIEDIESELKAAGVTGSQRESLLNNLIKERFGINEDVAKTELQAALDKVSREAEKQLNNWQLYDKIRKATGDENLAISFAFGEDGGETDYVELIKKRFSNVAKQYEGLENLTFDMFTDESQLTKVPDKLKEAWKTAYDEIDKYRQQNRDKELQAIEEYINDYGTFQQRILATEESYAYRIAEARKNGNATEAEVLTRQKNEKTQSIEIEAIKQRVDWGSVFGNFGTMFSDSLAPTLAELKALTQSVDFKDASDKDRKTVLDLIHMLKQTQKTFTDNLDDLGESVSEYHSAMEKLIAAQNAEKDAKTLVADKRGNLSAAKANGGDVGLAQQELADAEVNLKTASENVATLGVQAQNAGFKVGELAETIESQISTFNSALSGLRSKDLAGVGDSLMKIDRLFNNGAVIKAAAAGLSKLLSGKTGLLGKVGNVLAQSLGESGYIGSIIGAILSILDILKDGIGALVSSLIDTILGAVEGIIKNVLNGTTFTSIFNSVVSGIGGVLDGITFGGFSSWFSSGNGKAVQNSIDRLTERNKLLEQSIDDLTGTIKGYSSTDAIVATRDAIDLQKEINKNYLAIAEEQAGYHNAHHSFNYYWGGFSQEQINRLSKQIGRQWDGNLWSLSPEEMKVLRANIDMWEEIRGTGKGGYGKRVANDLEDYIDQAGKIEELTNQLYETLTGMTFDSMYDSFLNTLYDMNSTAKDFADDVSEYFFRAMLNKRIGDLLGKRLEAWYEKYAKAVESGSIDDPKVREALTNEYMGYVDEALAERERLAALIGYTGEGSADGLSAGIQGVTEDTADLLASYLNAVRADVSEQTHILWPRLLDDMLPQMNAIAESQLREQKKIAANTLINANAAVAIEQSNAEIRDILKRNIAGGGDFRIS